MSFRIASRRRLLSGTTGAVLVILSVGDLGAQTDAQGMFRGDPAHTGNYSGGGPVLAGMAWRFATNGDVVSSPTIVGGTVYVGSNDGHVYALDLATGDRRWATDLGSGVGSSPAVGAGLVYVTVRDGAIHALDAANGVRRWRVATGKLVPFPWGHESGDVWVSSPTFIDNTIVVGSADGRVYRIDAATGRVRWRAPTAGRIRGSPAIAGGRVYIGAFDGRVYCFDLSSGREIWKHDTEGVSLNSANYGFDRRSVQSSPAVDNGTVYVGARDGFLYAIDAATGQRRWRFDHKVSWVNSSPAVAAGVIFAGSSDGRFLQAVDSTGKELWRATTDNTVWSSPAVAGDVVYFGDGTGRVHAVDRRTGASRWTFRTASTAHSSPSVSGEYVVIGSTDGNVYALRATSGPAVHRAVFFDSTHLRRARNDRSEPIARYLTDRGYQPLDSAALVTFLTERIADRAPSVIVFAIDHANVAILADPIERSLLRRYLDAGGKVVWPGVPPGILPPTMPEGQIRLDWATPGALTDVPHDSALFDRRGARATSDGAKWGLPNRWRDAWSVAPGGATRVLGMDEWGLAAAWVKSFGGDDGTGFVRVPTADLFAIYMAAEYRRGGRR
ncbi:MAG TPA: PQQ-binding-like beta-propeller repeat protein [Gemmatimonadaceae bacterium]|nr:PQQ-binding-like beta-propeller repeat protein [Gemmatimonadaceae bacterium]